MTYAPIALFVYNRPLHTKQTIKALQLNNLSAESDLIIFSDGPRSESQTGNVAIVRDLIKSIKGFKSVKIIEREKNYGLAESIIDGVSNICRKYGKAIVLEDDIVTSPYFLQYMNKALNIYEHNKKISSIHGYIYPIAGLPETFFLRGADCWGWATWDDRWQSFEANGSKLFEKLKSQKLLKRFDFNGAYGYSKMLQAQINGKNNSWAIRWHATAFLNNQYTLYPGHSLVKNIGNDGSGTHCTYSDSHSASLTAIEVTNFPDIVEETQPVLNLIEQYLRQQQNESKSFMQLMRRIKRKLTW